jgi:hypothetical protein
MPLSHTHAVSPARAGVRLRPGFPTLGKMGSRVRGNDEAPLGPFVP